ncbi:unnamed protein product [Diatraea saccharalis]|uniref:Uncharacterized protein n=1 Tax=Diatraea saccharalis TaxID=40085 RepID=A0A9N9RDM6_9NEOP|nr:unnamed protein product [Diatraea saccharalis]
MVANLTRHGAEAPALPAHPAPAGTPIKPPMHRFIKYLFFLDCTVLTTANAVRTNGLTYLQKHGVAQGNNFLVTHPVTNPHKSCLTTAIAGRGAYPLRHRVNSNIINNNTITNLRKPLILLICFIRLY